MDEKEILLNLNVNISSNFIEQEFPKLVNTIEVNLLEMKTTLQTMNGIIYTSYLKKLLSKKATV